MKHAMRYLMLAALAVSLTWTTGCRGEAEKTAEEAKNAEPAKKAEPAKDAPAEQAPAENPEEADPSAAVDAPAPDKAVPDVALVEPQPAGFDHVAALEKVRNHIPANTLMLAVFEPAGFAALARMLVDMPFVKLSEETYAKVATRQLAYLKEQVGANLGNTEALVLFVSPDNYGGVLLAGDVAVDDTDYLVPMKAGEHDYFSHRLVPKVELMPLKNAGSLVLFGKTPAASYAEKVLDGDNRMSEDRLKAFSTSMVRHRGASMATVLQLDNPKIVMGWAAGIGIPKPDRIGLYFADSKLHIEVEGNEDSRNALKTLIDQGRTLMRAELAKITAEVDESKLIAGLIVGNPTRTMDALMDEYFTPADADGRLALTLDMGSSSAQAVGIMGVLAAVAVPAFLKYTKRAKTSEAIDLLDKMYMGAVVYFSTPRFDENGARVPCQFPPSQASTPAAGTCCKELGGPDEDGNDRCDATPSWWETPTWKALNFQIPDDHYFVYEFNSEKLEDGTWEFSATAFGDLDCDGLKSTFQRYGRGIIGDNECEVEPGRGLFMENETE